MLDELNFATVYLLKSQSEVSKLLALKNCSSVDNESLCFGFCLVFEDF
jgi:hypothetical protein